MDYGRHYSDREHIIDSVSLDGVSLDGVSLDGVSLLSKLSRIPFQIKVQLIFFLFNQFPFSSMQCSLQWRCMQCSIDGARASLK